MGHRNGTFDLAMHTWRAPFDRIVALGNARQIPVLTPEMGESVSLQGTMGGRPWWAGVDGGAEPGRVEGRGRLQLSCFEAGFGFGGGRQVVAESQRRNTYSNMSRAGQAMVPCR